MKETALFPDDLAALAEDACSTVEGR